MDPLNAPLLIAWAIVALISVLTLGGCAGGSYSGGYPADTPYFAFPTHYYAAPAQQPRTRSTTCWVAGGVLWC